MVWLLHLLAFFYLFGTVTSLGGETRFFFTKEFAQNITHRQNVCHRYESVRSGQLELKYALDGFELRPVLTKNEFFNYDDVDGIPRNEPGLVGELLDEIARRAGFQWRNSFGVIEELPEFDNVTWTERLLWGIEAYDISIDWWDQSVERLEKGAAYIEPWFDGSIILIDKEDPLVVNTTGNLLNWLRPFDSYVWVLTLFTIILSGLVYQWIEALHDERDDRPWRQWMLDNLYLSMLNFTQNYEYAPNSLPGRVFGVSMGIWALVMTATYTANLASLFVDLGKQPPVIDSIDQAIAMEIPICTWVGTNADSVIKEKYNKAIRVAKASELEMYQALQRGECRLVAGYKDNWLGYRDNSLYNPDCDFEWVGRTVEVIKSAFAVKADAGYLCTSLVRDVFNLHMTELISDGILGDLWTKHRAKTQDINCNAEGSDNSIASSSSSEGNVGRQRSRTLRADSIFSSTMTWSEWFPTATMTTTTSNTSPAPHRHRRLAGAKSTGESSSVDPASSSLSMEQMLGTFVLHWGLMLIAIIMSTISKYYGKHTSLLQKTEQVTFRKNGPIIGSPPRRLNTSFTIRNPEGPPLDGAIEDDDGDGDDSNDYSSRNGNESNSHSYGDNNNHRGPIQHNYGFNENRPHRNQNQNRNHNSTSSDALIRSLQKEVRASQRAFKSAQHHWHDSYIELQTTQRNLASQMDTVVLMLQQVMEQQEQQQQGPNFERNRLFSQQRQDKNNFVINNGQSPEEDI